MRRREKWGLRFHTYARRAKKNRACKAGTIRIVMIRPLYHILFALPSTSMILCLTMSWTF